MTPANVATEPDATPMPPDDKADGPQVRTLLLTDLCGSTGLVERLGDTPARELFRAHDRLVLELQQRWRGRLIDRSDGLLLLFERPIDGLGFALDYNRGLHELGKSRKIALQARAGLHVGEVLTWRNSEIAVQFGAKPLEVEGLAKPMAGRLMTMARPGQILVSASAEPMARRAVSELDERGKDLVWKHWGRWRFKGVPQPQEIYEVGEPDIAPLRRPEQNHAKAWRDIPLWRRPAALAAELLLVAGLLGGAWFMTRPQPAIAFNERDWVVVGDLRNLTGDSVLDDSLEQAFRISLEQSRFVNVVSDLKTRDTLALMQRKQGTALDRALASEVAIRDGARAVILPTVSEVGGSLRVSAEVIDPHTQTTVYAASADGSGAGSALDSIDKVTGELRNKLGEALESIQKTSVSLPNVTTGNLDALKAYSLGQQRRYTGDAKAALAYFQRATQLDPDFALAYLAYGGVYVGIGDFQNARSAFAHAAQLRDRLSPREALLLDATIARMGPPGPAMQRWRQLIELYPDQLRARMVLGQMELFDAARFDSALAQAKAAAIPQFEAAAGAHYLQGMALVGLQRYSQALKQFETSRSDGYNGAVYSHAYAYAAQRDWRGVQRVLGQRRPTGIASAEVQVPQQAAVFALDQGHWDAARTHAQQAVRAAAAAEPVLLEPEQRIRHLSIEVLAVEPRSNATLHEALAAEIATTSKQMETADDTVRAGYAAWLQALGYLAARIGEQEQLATVLAQTDAFKELSEYPLLAQVQQVLHAEAERLRGQPHAAVLRLQPLAAQKEALLPVHSALLRALKADGDQAGARVQAQWLATHRGRAYMEPSMNGVLLAVQVADTTLALLDAAEADQALGNKDQAEQERAAFLRAWPLDDLPAGLRERVTKLR